jgi:hypothetical protein
VLPFLIVCNDTLLFKVLDCPEDGWGERHFDFLDPPKEERMNHLHQKIGKPYNELAPALKTNDDECRVVAITVFGTPTSALPRLRPSTVNSLAHLTLRKGQKLFTTRTCLQAW